MLRKYVSILRHKIGLYMDSKGYVWNPHMSGQSKQTSSISELLGRMRFEIRRFLDAHGLGEWTPLIPEQQFSDCLRHAVAVLLEHDSKFAFGDYLEFGVSRGTSMACTYRVLQAAALDSVRLIGFDSFEGMPAAAADEGWRPGEFWSTLRSTKRYLAQHYVPQEQVILVKGWFDDTLSHHTKERLNLQKASLIMIDCDSYSASRKALYFCGPLIHNWAVVIFDDWGWTSSQNIVGQKDAFSEFLNDFPDLTSEPLPAYGPDAQVFLLSRRLSM